MAEKGKADFMVDGERLADRGAQLGFFGDDGAPIAPNDPRRGPGRPAGAQNKLKSKVRDYLAAKGYRDPAEQLAMLAGLDQRELHPMAYAAQVAQLLGEPVMAVAREMRAAAEALLPYWHAKLTPDVQVNMPVVPIMMAVPGGMVGPDGMGGGQVLDGHAFAPLDVRAGLAHETVENQGLGDGASDGADGGARTE